MLIHMQLLHAIVLVDVQLQYIDSSRRIMSNFTFFMIKDGKPGVNCLYCKNYLSLPITHTV